MLYRPGCLPPERRFDLARTLDIFAAAHGK
jgi:hypothetical protein